MDEVTHFSSVVIEGQDFVFKNITLGGKKPSVIDFLCNRTVQRSLSLFVGVLQSEMCCLQVLCSC